MKSTQKPAKSSKQGMTLHKFIATGGKPKERKNSNFKRK